MKLFCTHGLFAVWKPPSLGSAKVTLILRNILQGGDTFINRDEFFLGRDVQEFGDCSLSSDFTIRNKSVWVKVGHGGTLDRAAEGVLVIGVGRDCKVLNNYLTKKNKGYVFTGELGKMTDTLDRNGVLIKECPWEHITREALENAMKQFHGNILQAPPIFSALKVNGRRRSDLAIQARLACGSDDINAPFPDLPKPRPVTIMSLELLKFDAPYFTVSVLCSSGTYMRSLARDIGHSLGTVCYVTSLIRTSQGSFTKDLALREEDWTTGNIRTAMEECRKLLGSQ